MKIFRSESRGIELVLALLFVFLLIVVFQNETIRTRLFSPESVIGKMVRTAGNVVYIGDPGRKYGITSQTTTVELAKMLSDMLLQGQRDERKRGFIVKELRKKADFVLRGRIDNIDTVELVNDYNAEGEFSVVVSVDKVEKGEYPYDTIEISSGYYASWLPFPVYPSYVKINYLRGDEVRVYVEDDPDFGYILSGGFFGIEPRDE